MADDAYGGPTAAERLREIELLAAAQLEAEREAQRKAEEAQQQMELRAMRAEERRQCLKNDRFWGIDFHQKELQAQARETLQMQYEEQLVWRQIAWAKAEAAREDRAYREAVEKQRQDELQRQLRETIAMAREEGLQTAIDRFWGVITEERQRRAAAERRLAQLEADRVKERDRKLRQLQQEWQEAAERQRKEEAAAKAAAQESYRRHYMDMFFSSQSSVDIINYRWPTNVPPPEMEASFIGEPSVADMHFPSVASGPGFDLVSIDAGVHTMHHLNPVRTGGRRHAKIGSVHSYYDLPSDLSDPSMPYHAASRGHAQRPVTSQRANDSSRIWPVPGAAVRATKWVTLRGWVLAAPAVMKALDKRKEKRNYKEMPRLYAALWKQSLLYLFNNEDDCRAFFQGSKSANSCVGFIDLESAVSVREHAFSVAAADEARMTAQQAQPADGSAEAPSLPDPDTLDPRVLEIRAVGQTWLLIPDPVPACHDKAKAFAAKQEELSKLETSAETLSAEAAARDAVFHQAEKKGPREGNYKLMLRAQSTTMAATIAQQNLANLRMATQQAREAAVFAADDWFGLWHDTIASAVAQRNRSVATICPDPALTTSTLDQIDPSMLSAPAAELIEAVALTKLGPWCTPVGRLTKVESLVGLFRTSEATAVAAVKAGLSRGSITMVRDTFGFIAPEDKMKTKQLFFYREDLQGHIGLGDYVSFDIVQDSRAQRTADVRAVNIQRVPFNPFVQYDEIESMPAADTNAAVDFCQPKLQQSSRAAVPSSPGPSPLNGLQAGPATSSMPSLTPDPAVAASGRHSSKSVKRAPHAKKPHALPAVNANGHSAGRPSVSPIHANGGTTSPAPRSR